MPVTDEHDITLPKKTVLYLPGLNATGIIADIGPEFRSLKLAPKVERICEYNGYAYASTSFTPVPEDIDSTLVQLMKLLNNDAPTVVVTSSFGAWPALMLAALEWPSNLKGIALINPFITVQGYAKKYGPIGRLWCSHFGFNRQEEEDVQEFHIPGSMVRSMLAEENNLFDGRLKELHRRPITLFVSGASRYRPNIYTEDLANHLDIPLHVLMPDALTSNLTFEIKEFFKFAEAN